MGSEKRDFREWEAFAKKLAAKFVAPGVDIEDLEQEALLTLLEELPKYDETLGVSLRVFIGRGVRNRLASLYRKALNLHQVEQFWLVKHVSGNRDLDVRAKSKEEAEAVLLARPSEYGKIENVKTLAPLGPSLDQDAGGNNEGDPDCMTLHELVGENPLQELGLLAAEMTTKVTSRERKNRKGEDLAEIFRLRSEGHTFEQIGAMLGRNPNSLYYAHARAQKRLNKKRAA